jgi:RNA recognition motif-containing protein
MGSKLYVGGLPYSTTQVELTDLFSAHGSVQSANVISDKFTGQSRGFGFVEMSSDEEAQAAITALNSTEFDGRTLTVNEAKPQAPRTVVVVVAMAVVVVTEAAGSNEIATMSVKRERSSGPLPFLC